MYKLVKLLIMAALLVNFVHIINSMLIRHIKPLELNNHKHSSKQSEEHSKNLEKPKILHKVLDEEFLNKFDEIIVIGDLHGCFDEMQELIDHIESTKEPSTKILKIFVGDLINKGPKNFEIIDYMMSHKHDCVSVRGNHEEIAIKIGIVTRNGGKLKKKMRKYEWAKNLTSEQLDYLIQLPYTISLPITDKKNAIIVHAGLVAGLPLEKHDPYDLVHMRGYVFEDYYEGEGIKPVKSNNIGEPWCSNYPGPDHVYFGHNSKRGFQDCEFATGIDTGCVSGNYLTGIFIKGSRKNKIVKIKSKQVYSSKTKANLAEQLNEESNFNDLVELDAELSNLKRNNTKNSLMDDDDDDED